MVVLDETGRWMGRLDICFPEPDRITFDGRGVFNEPFILACLNNNPVITDDLIVFVDFCGTVFVLKADGTGFCVDAKAKAIHRVITTAVNTLSLDDP